MSDYVLSLLLGIVEGLTEFLPISSTAHLRIAEFLLHVQLADGYWKMYSIAIQLGAILCLPVYFRARIAKFIGYTRGTTPLILAPLKILWYLLKSVFTSRPVQFTLTAFVVTAIPSFLLIKVIGKHLENLKNGKLTYGVNDGIAAIVMNPNQSVFCGFCGQKIVSFSREKQASV